MTYQVFGQIEPQEIRLLDQLNFLSSYPTFDPFFCQNGLSGFVKLLEPDEARGAVSARESAVAELVLPNASLEVARDARVERAGVIGHDIDVIATHGISRSKFVKKYS
jgi:hypothetical protein